MVSIEPDDIIAEMKSNNREDVLHRLRHSCAHIMAQAVMERFADSGRVKLGVGPAIADGFYYDFDLPRPVSDEDLQWIEKRMKEIVDGDCRFEQSFISFREAREMFEEQPYKLELIELIQKGQLDDDGQELSNNRSRCSDSLNASQVSIFRHDSFVDLCQGPHVSNSKEIEPEAIKLLSLAGSYWRGDERNPMLQRIYGTVFRSKEELLEHLHFLEEAKRRDHRQIGKKLELFHFDDSAPGMPYWLPNGMRVLNELLSFWRETHEKQGYEEISTPVLNNKKLWEISGHWEHYQENMFLVEQDDDTVYGLKPMNCPNAMVVFGLKLRSYRDLPMRLSDCDVLHRHERSGTLNGLFRVQKFQQDDAHIFIEPDQIESEYEKILDLCHHFYSIFDLSYSLRLSLRPDKYVGDEETWNRAEEALRKILDKRLGQGNYLIAEKEGAFYGPKIDILMQDSLKRKWQMGTIQLDFQQPERFGLKYIDRDGKRKTPVVIHRVIYGSIDRFIGVLLEDKNGELPVWLSPLPVLIVPIADRHNDYARQLQEKLLAAGVRSKIDAGGGRMNRKIRDAELLKVPYILIVGDKEANERSVALRLRSGEQEFDVPFDSFLSSVEKQIKERSG